MACCCMRVRVGEREGSGVERLCQQQIGIRRMGKVDLPGWKGKRGRLAAAKEWRTKVLEAISQSEAVLAWWWWWWWLSSSSTRAAPN